MTTKNLLKQIAVDVKDIKKRLNNLENLQRKELHHEEGLEEDEDRELEELARLEHLEKEIEKDVRVKPLAKITYRDVTKGIIGSFFGIVGHFAFFYGEKIAHDLTLWRAHALIITSFLLLVIILYFTGFRKVTRDAKHHYIAFRACIIFLTAHVVITLVLTLFGRISFHMTFIDIYKNIAAVSILAVMGAATADLIGGE